MLVPTERFRLERRTERLEHRLLALIDAVEKGKPLEKVPDDDEDRPRGASGERLGLHAKATSAASRAFSALVAVTKTAAQAVQHSRAALDVDAQLYRVYTSSVYGCWSANAAAPFSSGGVETAVGHWFLLALQFWCL